MNQPIILWDNEEMLPQISGRIVYWNKISSSDGSDSIPELLEKNADNIKEKYLNFIYEFGKQEIFNKSIIEHFCVTEPSFSFWWMTFLAEKSPFKSPSIFTILKLFVLEDYLKQKETDSLYYAGQDLNLYLTLESFCDRKNILFSGNIAKKKRKLIKNYLSPFFILVYGIFWALKRFLKTYQLHSKENSESYSENGVSIASHFVHLDPERESEGIFYSNQWEKFPQIIKKFGKDINWIHIFIKSKLLNTDRKVGQWITKYNSNHEINGYHAILESRISFKFISRVFYYFFKNIPLYLRIGSANKLFRYEDSAFNFYHILKSEWRESIAGYIFLSNLFWKFLFEKYLSIIPKQRTGFYLFENQGWEQAFLYEWKKNGHGKVIGVQHATVPYWHLYYFQSSRLYQELETSLYKIPDYIAVNNEQGEIYFKTQGYPSDKILCVEALRYNEIFQRKKKAKYLNQNGVKKRILILGDMIPSSMDSLLTILNNVYPNIADDYEPLAIKPHPGLEPNFLIYKNLNLNIVDGKISDLLEDYDFVISANSTSAALDAYILNANVLLFYDGSNLNLSPLRGFEDVRCFSSSEQLDEVLRLEFDFAAVKKRKDFYFNHREYKRWNSFLNEIFAS